MNKSSKLSYLLFSTLILGVVSLTGQPIVEASETSQQTTLQQTDDNRTTTTDSAVQSDLKSPEDTEAAQISENRASPEGISPVSVQSNLLQNGEFTEVSPKTGQWSDTSANAWQVWVDKRQTQEDAAPTITVDNQHQLIMSSDKAFRGVVHQTVMVDDDKEYQVSFDIKTTEKTGNAFVRLLGFEDKQQKQIWHSDMTTGTTDWHVVKGLFTPKKGINSVKVEIFYEKGLGQVALRQIYFGVKEKEKQKEQLPQVLSEISLPLHKKHVLPDTGFRYEIENPEQADLSGGIISPKTIGETKVNVFGQDGQLVGQSRLVVTPAEQVYSKLVKAWNDVVAGNDLYDPKNPDMVKFHEALDKKVAQHLAMDAEQKLWPTLADFAEKSSHLTTSYRKLEDMAKQVTNPHSIYYQDETVIRLVKKSMAWLYQEVYNEQKSISGNWWDYEIGTPRAINNILSLMNSYFSDEEIKKYTAPIEKFVPDSNYFRSTLPNSRFEALGGNLVDMGRVKIISGILRQDAKEITDAVASLSKLFTFTSSGEGFYEDGSYIAHTNVAYTGAYGNVLIDGLAQLLPVIQKSAAKLPTETLDIIYQWVNRSFLPLMVRGELMDMSRGRSISRANSEAHVAAVEALRGIVLLSDLFDQDKQIKLKTAVKSILHADDFYRVYDNLRTYREFAAIKNLLNDENISILPPVSHITTFNHMDKLAMYDAEKDFGFALSMHSSRTQNYEAMNNENLRGWYTGDGMFYLYNKDLGHYSQHYWATVNPYKLPGTTETAEKRMDATQDLVKDNFVQTGQVTLPSSFVGSLKYDQHNALASMDFTNWNKTLTAKKSWAILDGKIVFLGSDIINKSNERAYTTIEQRKETVPYSIYVNGEKSLVHQPSESIEGVTSVFLEGSELGRHIGYIFLKPTHLTISRNKQEGSWKAINSAQSDDNVSNHFLTIEQEHRTPNDTYAYVMVPNVDRETFNHLVKNLTVSLLKNDAREQIVYDAQQELWMITKYDNEKRITADYFEMTEPGLYIIKRQGEHSYMGQFYNPVKMQTSDIQDKVRFLPRPSQNTMPIIEGFSETKDKLATVDIETVQLKLADISTASTEEKRQSDSISSPVVSGFTPKKHSLPRTGEAGIWLNLFGFNLLAFLGLAVVKKHIDCN